MIGTTGAALMIGVPTMAYADVLTSLDTLVAQSMAMDHIPGLSLAVARSNRAPFLVRGYGRASLTFSSSMTPESLFHIGSLTKHMTGLLILRLAAAGRIRLDSAIGDILGDLPDAWRPLRIGQLLYHTSGLPDYEDLLPWDRPFDQGMFRETIARLPMNFAAGASWSYSNSGYILLGDIIEAVTGRCYGEILERDLLAPAGLHTSRVDDAEAVIANRAEPYEWTGTGWKHAIRMSSSMSGTPDGAVLMSAADAVHWSAALDSGNGLEPNWSKLVTQPTRLNNGRSYPYGVGWNLDKIGEHSVQYHTGGVPGFTSFAYRVPDQGLTLFLFSNVGLGSSLAQRRLGLALVEKFVPGTTPLSLKPIVDRFPDLTKAALEILSGQKLNSDLFASEMRALLDGPVGRGAIPSLGDLLPIDAIMPVEERIEEVDMIRRYRVVQRDRFEHHSIGYAADGRIFRMTRL
jgi:CubicO group peptidase (beta-lactamase class C family)